LQPLHLVGSGGCQAYESVSISQLPFQCNFTVGSLVDSQWPTFLVVQSGQRGSIG
jgi:hypothetical protein